MYNNISLLQSYKTIIDKENWPWAQVECHLKQTSENEFLHKPCKHKQIQTHKG
jgi:hypothetical protein